MNASFEHAMSFLISTLTSNFPSHQSSPEWFAIILRDIAKPSPSDLAMSKSFALHSRRCAHKDPTDSLYLQLHVAAIC